MAEAAVSAIASDVVGRLASLAIDEFVLLWGLEDDVLALRGTSRLIQAVLHDAEVKQRTEEAIKLWLVSLRSASLEVENVLDEASTEAMLQRLHKERGINYRVKEFFSSHHNWFMVRQRIAHKVRNIRRKLDVIKDDGDKFGLAKASTRADAGIVGDTRSRETSSLVLLSEVYGRGAEMEMVAQKICNRDLVRHDAQVYAIWGIGGIGKTTLAQLVYNHESVKTQFYLKCWVYVSREFDVKKLTKQIIESIDRSPCQLSQLDGMQVSLQEKLRGKRFLIVLDDIWNEDRTKWDEVRKALCSGSEGSIVMVTTRMQGISTMMAVYSEFQHQVGSLSEEDSWSLFEKLAFGNGIEGINRRELEPIGKETVKKCKGVSLAVRTLGGLMCLKNSAAEWQAVNKSEIWELEEDDDYMLRVLKLSYDDLRPHLKQCFAYCCLFPKGHEMVEKELIGLWMANGFIPSRGEADLYSLGKDIINYLVSRSFFELVAAGMPSFCKMHDLMHDLARYVMRHDCAFREPDKEMIIPEEALHYSSSYPDFLYSENLKSLRSMIFIISGDEFFKGSVSEISKQRYLRVLRLTGIKSKTLPESICKLQHLRYLNMSRSNIEVLPELIIYLQNLQVLLLKWCTELRKLPKGMRYLRNLQHLDVEYCDELQCMPVGMKELGGLRILPRFIVGGENGAKAGELGNVNLLRGKLELLGLEKVEGLEEAKSVNLKCNTNLTSLVLSWNGESQRDEEVLEGLEPNSSLEKLQISGRIGKNICPSWMGNLMNLVEITFFWCDNCESIPALGKLPNLKLIYFLLMDSLKGFHDEDKIASEEDILFPCLQQLIIDRCPGLDSLPNNLPKLRELSIDRCDGLSSLPDELLSSKEFASLTILGCEKLRKRYEKGIGEDWPKISHIPKVHIFKE